MSTSTAVRQQMCSVFSTANNEDPGGSASWWDRCLVFELPKPWASEVAQSRHFPSSVTEALDRATALGRGAKLQCVAPDLEYTAQGCARVMLFSRPQEQFSTYRKDDFQVPSNEVGALVNALLVQPENIERFDRYRQDTSGVRDILVCTHGSQDCCCATFGYPAYQVLRHQVAPQLGGSLRVWRVSHLGGHRFAPNIMDMPEGRNWVRMGQDDLAGLVLRNRPVSDFRQFYRGWAGLQSSQEQVAEREAFMREGWDWTTFQISSRLEEPTDDGRDAQVRIEFTNQALGTAGGYDATVARVESAPKIDCLAGTDSGETPQYMVTSLARSS